MKSVDSKSSRSQIDLFQSSICCNRVKNTYGEYLTGLLAMYDFKKDNNEMQA